MGREIRRVPPDWEHPRDERTGKYLPMYDCDFLSEARKWMDEAIAWDNGTHPKKGDSDCLFFWQYSNPPDEETCRPAFTSEPTAYQIYETVSEGTPTSPVFQNTDEMRKWLIGEGHSPETADAFIKRGWVPSAMFIPGRGLVAGIDSAGL